MTSVCRAAAIVGDRLETDDIEKIRAFLIKRAHDLKNELAGAPPATEEKTE